MKKLIVLLALLPLLTSCNFCGVLTQGINGMADWLAGPGQLDCTNVALMEQDFNAKLDPQACQKVKDKCKAIHGEENCGNCSDAEKRGIIASAVCPLVDMAIMYWLNNELGPSLVRWNCKNTPSQTNINQWLLAGCTALPF